MLTSLLEIIVCPLSVLKLLFSLSTIGIRALSNTGPQGFDGGLNSAILRYNGAHDSDPTSIQTTSVIPLLETNLHVRVAVLIHHDVTLITLCLASHPNCCSALHVANTCVCIANVIISLAGTLPEPSTMPLT